MTPLGRYIKKSGLAQKAVAESIGLTPERLNGLCNDPDDLLYGDDFYSIVKTINGNLNQACDEVFKAYRLKVVDKEIWKSDLGIYFSKHAKPTKYISEATKISSSRLSKLLNEREKRPYAWEIYLIALALEKEPSEVFEGLYGPKGIGRT